jgi:hypothetical protein
VNKVIAIANANKWSRFKNHYLTFFSFNYILIFKDHHR